MSEGIVIGVVQSEKCGMGNGTFKQNFFENTITFVSKPSPDHSLISTFQSSTTLILEDLQQRYIYDSPSSQLLLIFLRFTAHL